jgi:cell fate regulator YaaT (PSP1 superfamily)
MTNIAKVVFEEAGNVYFFAVDTNKLSLVPGDVVIVETKECRDNAKVTCPVTEIDESKFGHELRKVIRKANDFDIGRIAENKEKEEEYFQTFVKKIEKHGLKMNPIKVSLSFDNRKVTFFYTAESRVDFRELLKDLTREFRMRIELRQIRDEEEVKLVGGIGHCGMVCCCKLFLPNKEATTARMAAQQGLAPNSCKIQGLCGKLMCCLKFEEETYKKQSKGMPQQGRFASIDGDEYKIIEANALTEKVALRKVASVDEDTGAKILSNETLVLDKDEFNKRAEKRTARKETPKE